MSEIAGVSPWLALILVGFLPNEIWRLLGVLVARGLDEDSEIVTFIRGIATAVLAGVIAKLVLFPPGALAGVPLAIRLVAIVSGLAGFYAVRRSVFAGVIIGEIVLVGGALIFARQAAS